VPALQKMSVAPVYRALVPHRAHTAHRRKDAFEIKHPAAATFIKFDFWPGQTQASPDVKGVKSRHARGRGRHHLFCTLCSRQKGECICNFVYKAGEVCVSCYDDADDCNCAAADRDLHPICLTCRGAPDVSCSCASFHGRSLCVCSSCRLPRPSDVAAGAPSCSCVDFQSACEIKIGEHFQMRSNEGVFLELCA
jgi:hypothetical protein